MEDKNVLKTSFLVLGIVIGAGFASGKELLAFFSGYGAFIGFLIVIMNLLIFYIVFIFIRVGKFIKPKTVSDITKSVFKKYSPIFDVVIIFSLFVSVFAMLAGADALAADAFVDYSFPFFGIILSVLVVVIVSGGLSSLLKANSIIVPIIISFIVVVTVGFLMFGQVGIVELPVETGFIGIGTSLFSTLLYVCMNMLAVTILVAELGPILKYKQTQKISALSAVLISICISLVLLALFNSSNAIIGAEMPMVRLSYSLGEVFGGIYSLVVLFGIFTTLISCGFAVNNWLKQFIKDRVLSISIIVTLGFLLSRLGFGFIVESFYPIEGLFGLIFILGVISFYYKNRSEIKKLD